MGVLDVTTTSTKFKIKETKSGSKSVTSGGRMPMEYLYDGILKTNSYLMTGSLQPVWAGKGAEYLKLSGKVDPTIFNNLMMGLSPDGTQEWMKPVYDPKTKTFTRCMGVMETYSSDKSISVMSALGTAEQTQELIENRNRAIEKADAWFEEQFFARAGKGGKTPKKIVGLIRARFTHMEARGVNGQTPDPDSHVHTENINMGLVEQEDGSVKALSLSTAEFYDLKMERGAMIRAYEAQGMLQLGYELERHGENEQFFRIKGIDERLLLHFSKRSQEIDQYCKEKGLGDSAIERQKAAMESRSEKESDLSFEELQKSWIQQTHDLGFDPQSIQAAQQDRFTPMEAKEEKIVLERLTNLEFYFTQTELNTEYLNLYAGSKVSPEEALAKAREKWEELAPYRKDVDGKTYTTTHEKVLNHSCFKALLKPEQRVKADAEWAMKLHDVLTAKAQFEQRANFKMTSDQAEAFERVLQSNSAVSLIVGKAGAGKTTMMEAAKEAYQAQGMTVIGCAPSGKAAEGLQQSAQMDSQTVDQLLIDLKGGKTQLDAKTVVFLDEAGMVGLDNFYKLTEACHKAGAKLIAVGDHNQLRPVSAGSPFYDAQHWIDPQEVSTLHQVRRQKTADSLSIANTFSGDTVEAATVHDMIELLDRQEHLTRFEDPSDGRQSLVQDVFKDLDQSPQPNWNNIAVLAGTNRDVDALNERIQAERLARGEIKNAVQVPCLDANDNLIQRTFAEGDRFMFNEKASKRRVAEGSDTASTSEIGTIRSVKPNSKRGFDFVVEMDDGREVRFNTNQGKRRENRLMKMNLAYAMTVHKSQGITVDNTYVFRSGNEQKDHLYVALSRQRFNVRLYSDQEGLDSLDKVSIQHKTFDLEQLDETTRLQIEEQTQQALQAMKQGPKTTLPPVEALKTPEPQPETAKDDGRVQVTLKPEPLDELSVLDALKLGVRDAFSLAKHSVKAGAQKLQEATRYILEPAPDPDLEKNPEFKTIEPFLRDLLQMKGDPESKGDSLAQIIFDNLDHLSANDLMKILIFANKKNIPVFDVLLRKVHAERSTTERLFDVVAARNDNLLLEMMKRGFKVPFQDEDLAKVEQRITKPYGPKPFTLRALRGMKRRRGKGNRSQFQFKAKDPESKADYSTFINLRQELKEEHEKELESKLAASEAKREAKAKAKPEPKLETPQVAKVAQEQVIQSRLNAQAKTQEFERKGTKALDNQASNKTSLDNFANKEAAKRAQDEADRKANEARIESEYAMKTHHGKINESINQAIAAKVWGDEDKKPKSKRGMKM